MTFGWGGGGGGGEGGGVSKGSGFYIHVFVAILSKAHFVMSSGLLFTLFAKLLVFVCKDENLVISLYTYHTTYIYGFKITPFFFFFCVLSSLQFEKLKHCPILLILD